MLVEELAHLKLAETASRPLSQICCTVLAFWCIESAKSVNDVWWQFVILLFLALLCICGLVDGHVPNKLINAIGFLVPGVGNKLGSQK